MTPAERLRAAATRLREVAGAAEGGPWTFTVDDAHTDYPWRLDGTFRNWRGEECNRDIARVATTDDALYFATMSPPVALALADWLDYTAERQVGEPVRAALAVADAVLGGES